MNELALFAGGGGGILGGLLLGWRTVCAVEIDPYCRSVLLARQRDGILPPFPIWDDVRTFNGKQWRGCIDVISGGFPCQDISAAGKGAGIDGERSGLWNEFARIIREVRPRFALVENSPMLTARGIGSVLGDLAASGFDAQWDVLGAAHVGAPHLRRRIWILAHSNGDRLRDKSWRRGGACRPSAYVTVNDGEARIMADGDSERLERPEFQQKRLGQLQRLGDGSWWTTEPDVGRVAHGLAHRVDRLRAIGNGQVPAVARLAWETLAP